MSGSCKLHKDSLAPRIRDALNSCGVCIIPVPASLQKSLESLGKKACQQYAMKEFAENIILLDTGHAKLMTAYYPLEILRDTISDSQTPASRFLCGWNRQFNEVPGYAAEG